MQKGPMTLFFFGILAVVSIGITGCGDALYSREAILSGSTETALVENEPITLLFWDMARGTNTYIEGAEKFSKTFTEVMSNVTIDYLSIPWQNRYETFSVAIASGNAPDISTGGGFQQHQFAASGDILELDSVIREWEAEGSLNDFAPGLIDFFKYEGKQVGIPFNNETRTIWYRKDLFEAAGINVAVVSMSFDELFEAAVRLHDPENGIYGMVFPSSDAGANVLFLNWFVSNGGGIWKEDSKTPDWTNPKNLEALNFVTRLKEAGVFPEGMASFSEADAHMLFLQGKAAIMPSVGTFGTMLAEQDADMVRNVGVLPPLKGPSAEHPAGITAYNATMAYKQTKYPEEAKAFLKWYSENNLCLWTQYGTGSLPPRISQMNDPAFNGNKINPYTVEIVQKWEPYLVSTMTPGREANLPQNTLDAERWWRDVCQAVLLGEKSNAEILQEFQEKTERLISGMNY